MSASPCPYCRQRITIILPYFSDDEKNSAEPADAETRSKIRTDVYTYNRRYSGETRSVIEQIRDKMIEQIRDLPMLLRDLGEMIEQIRDLPMLLRDLGVYLFSGEGLHLAFQLSEIALALAVFGLIGLLDEFFICLLISMFLTFFFRQIVLALAVFGLAR